MFLRYGADAPFIRPAEPQLSSAIGGFGGQSRRRKLKTPVSGHSHSHSHGKNNVYPSKKAGASAPAPTLASASSNNDDYYRVDAAYDIRPAPGKGLGVFAVRPIAALSAIIEEAPLLACPSSATSSEEMERFMKRAMSKLAVADQEFILHGLTNATGDRQLHLAGCYRTNALPCPPDRGLGVIFKCIAMANHSCMPNARYEWVPGAQGGGSSSSNTNPSSGTGSGANFVFGTGAGIGRLIALEDIEPGAEITISYIPLQPHAPRRATLRAMFGFDCTCALCRLGADERRAEDRRIREIEGLELMLLSDVRKVEADDPKWSLDNFARLVRLYGESRVNHERDILAACVHVVRLCNVRFAGAPATAAANIQRVCGFSPEEAVRVCRDWYAHALESGEIEDQAGGVQAEAPRLGSLFRSETLN